MLQELLMALNGFPGNIFFSAEDGIRVSSNIPHLHPAEKTILEKLCLLGTKCKYLSDFVQKHKIHSIPQRNEICGLYLESFCCGLDSVLSTYRKELIDIEEELLEDPFLPLTHFLKLEKFSLLFQILHNLVADIESRKVHGCQILDLLYAQSSSGVPLVEMSMNKILQKCHSVMFTQVLSWMTNGFIEDPYQEFFIQPDDFLDQTPSKNHLQKHLENGSLVKYQVKPELLPSYLPGTLASKILFIGEYVSVLGATHDSDAYSLFLKKESVFAKKIEKLLEKTVFSLLSFETVIDDIRKNAAEHLWQVIIKGSNVVHQFKIMKDFYLLGRGELFHDFIEEANHLLKMPVTTMAEKDASKIFHLVCQQIFPEDDSITEKFHIVLYSKKENQSDKNKLETGWSSIGLQYDIPHPLHILISPSTIDRYNMVFRFLLSVRKVQIELHQCWAHQMQSKGAGHLASFMPLWKLRSHMSFLIDNFQYYVLVDVLESCFDNLLNKMENVKDFEEIQHYHNCFLSSLVSQCFLELKTVFIVINEILEACSTFCSLMKRVHLSINQRDLLQFENIKLNFQRQTSLLFRTLSGVRSHQVSPHLAQLLLRIDYNKYLSSCGGQLGGDPANRKI